jgi:hypothetical protein
MAKRLKGTARIKAAFLDELARTANVTRASALVGVTPRCAYLWRQADEAFAAAWAEAVELGTNALEDEAVRRAFEGTERPVFQGGRLVGHERIFSDNLLALLLKARRPEAYKDRQPVHPGSARSDFNG